MKGLGEEGRRDWRGRRNQTGRNERGTNCEIVASEASRPLGGSQGSPEGCFRGLSCMQSLKFRFTNEILRSTDLHFKEMTLSLQPEACLHPDHPRCSAPRVSIVHQFNEHPGQVHCSVSFVFNGLIC